LDATFSHVTDDRLRQTTTDRRTQYCSISVTVKNFSRQCETALSPLLRYVTLRYVMQRCHLLLNFAVDGIVLAWNSRVQTVGLRYSQCVWR